MPCPALPAAGLASGSSLAAAAGIAPLRPPSSPSLTQVPEKELRAAGSSLPLGEGVSSCVGLKQQLWGGALGTGSVPFLPLCFFFFFPPG